MTQNRSKDTFVSDKKQFFCLKPQITFILTAYLLKIQLIPTIKQLISEKRMRVKETEGNVRGQSLIPEGHSHDLCRKLSVRERVRKAKYRDRQRERPKIRRERGWGDEMTERQRTRERKKKKANCWGRRHGGNQQYTPTQDVLTYTVDKQTAIPSL